jgi:DNA polymerase I-like protein with 3'-5' exonuclease and polymerase domains
VIAVPTFPPGFLLRSKDGTKGEARYKETVVADFEKAVQYLGRGPDWDERVIWTKTKDGRLVNLFPTVADVERFVRGAQGTTVACDVETTGEEPLNSNLICIGFASSNGTAICVPRLKQGGHAYWTQGDWARVCELLKWIFYSPNYSLVFHNGAFDFLVLWAHGFFVQNWTGDTIIAHHILDSELPHGLAYVGSRFLEVPYYKDDVKGKEAWIDLDDKTLRAYNARDCLTTIRALPILLAQIRQLNQEHLYRREFALSKVMVKATLKGLLVDMNRRDDPTLETAQTIVKKGGKIEPNPDFGYPRGLGPRMRVRRTESLAMLRNIYGDQNFNPGSPIQLKKFLYEYLKFPVVKRSEKTNQPSTDKEAMMLLSLHAQKGEQRDALKNLSKWRKCDKILGTWIEGLRILGDGRVHPSWKLFGSVSGRMASSPNAQNLNSAIKRIFCAPPGSKLVGVDLSQAELRGIAYMARDEELLHAYQLGLNVHTVNATLLFKVRNPGEDTNQATEDYLKMAVPKYLECDYDSLPQMPASKWSRTRRLAKNFCFACLASDTIVPTVEDGPKPISEVLVGDTVWSSNGKTKVTAVVNRGVRACLRLSVLDQIGNSHSIIGTPEHMILAANGTYKAIADLQTGDELKSYARGVIKVQCVEPCGEFEVWDLEVSDRAHNFVLAAPIISGNCNYGAMPETIYDVIKSERDPETDEAMFPDLELGLIEALKFQWEDLHPWIPRWWKEVSTMTKAQGHYRCPVSDRIRWYRGGFKQNEMVNMPIQTLVASHMERLLLIDQYLGQACGNGSTILVQVHDSVVTETEDKYVDVTKEIITWTLNQPFAIPGIMDRAVLPADKPSVGTYLDEV